MTLLKRDNAPPRIWPRAGRDRAIVVLAEERACPAITARRDMVRMTGNENTGHEPWYSAQSSGLSL